MGLNRVQLVAPTGVTPGSYDPAALTVGPDGRLVLAADSDLGGGVSGARQTFSYTTPASLAPGTTTDFTMPLGKVCNLFGVTLSHPAWIRFYRSVLQRNADTRVSPGGTFQSLIDLADAKPYGEAVSSALAQTVIPNPVPTLVGDSGGFVYIRLVNYFNSAAVITVTTVSLPLEV